MRKRIWAGMLLAGWMATLPAWGQEAGRKDGWYHVIEEDAMR
ncbi:hypothetical protein [uncultured Bacteroides sp.]|nr:hypothetical protein [uncultured Bacteroides sp.]